MSENLIKFVDEHSMDTVNAELIKAGYTITYKYREYRMHRCELWKKPGNIVKIFIKKMSAFNYASFIMERYWRNKE